jgi:hypothetical protein
MLLAAFAMWPRSVGKQWATVVRSEMAARVDGPSTTVHVDLVDGREGQLEMAFSEGSAEVGDHWCVLVAERLVGGITLQRQPDALCGLVRSP